jgi:hypothetical protein
MKGNNMPRHTRKHLPGRRDINAQFTAENMHHTLKHYKSMKKSGSGDYEFGALSSKFHGLEAHEDGHWKDDLKSYAKDVQDEIKRIVVRALNHKDEKGKDSPIPVSFKWSAGPKGVKSTYTPAPKASYTIEIFGHASPAPSLLAARRAKNKAG